MEKCESVTMAIGSRPSLISAMVVSRAMSGVSGASFASEDEPPGVVVIDSTVNVGNVGKLDQILLRLEKLDKNYGYVHKSIEALSQSVDRLTGHVSHVSKNTADLEIAEKRNSRKSMSPAPVTRMRNSKPGTVLSLVQMQSDCFQEIVMAGYISHRRSDDDEGYPILFVHQVFPCFSLLFC